MTALRIPITCLAIGIAALSATVAQEAAREPKPRIEYKFTAQGQIGLTVLDAQSNPIPITFADDGETNSTVVRIDGDDVEFGSEDGKWQGGPQPLGRGKDGKQRRGHKATWVYGSIAITQIVEIVPSKAGRLDACVIRYEIENRDDQAHEVGLRAVIDTQIVDNDGNPFALPGKRETITTCADFGAGKDLPAVVKALEHDNVASPGFVAHFTLKVGGGLEAPDRFVITRLPEDFDIWDVPVKNCDGDAAVAMFWNPRRIEAGARRSVGYAYGQGAVSLPAAKQ